MIRHFRQISSREFHHNEKDIKSIYRTYYGIQKARAYNKNSIITTNQCTYLEFQQSLSIIICEIVTSLHGVDNIN